MDRILADPRFNTSNLCVMLLRHLVEHSLRGNHEHIKERTLGIEVFGRTPDYDTNADTVVRRTASAIRRRLARCYEDPDAAHTVEIRLTVGSYIPEFDFERNHAAVTNAGAITPDARSPLEEREAVVLSTGTGTWRRSIFWIVAVLLVLGNLIALVDFGFSQAAGYLTTS